MDLIYFSSHLAALNIPAVVGMPSYDAESIAGTAIFNRLLAKWFDWAVYQEILGEFGLITCFGLGFLLFNCVLYGIWSGYILFLAISEM